jgi:hypothetical protein
MKITGPLSPAPILHRYFGLNRKIMGGKVPLGRLHTDFPSNLILKSSLLKSNPKLSKLLPLSEIYKSSSRNKIGKLKRTENYSCLRVRRVKKNDLELSPSPLRNQDSFNTLNRKFPARFQTPTVHSFCKNRMMSKNRIHVKGDLELIIKSNAVEVGEKIHRTKTVMKLEEEWEAKRLAGKGNGIEKIELQSRSTPKSASQKSEYEILSDSNELSNLYSFQEF